MMTVSRGSATPFGPPGRARAQLRATDADRDAVVGRLQQAYADGRLSPDEHEGRVERALAAATYSDLDTLLTDLPEGRISYPGMARPASLRTNSLAITSLACGVAQFPFWLLASVPAIVCGHKARGQIRRTGEQGASMALAGLVLGYIGVALAVLAFALFVLLAVKLSSL